MDRFSHKDNNYLVGITIRHKNFTWNLNFTVVGRAVKLKSVNFYYYNGKILSCFDPVKFKIRQLSFSQYFRQTVKSNYRQIFMP